MIELLPFQDTLALEVFRGLDPHDHMEAEVIRGAPAGAVTLYAEWHNANAWRAATYVATHGPLRAPFAVLGLSNTGQAGVGQAALLSKSHRAHKRPLAQLARIIRRDLAAWTAERGIHRIECRCWAAHPTASRFLEHAGFTLDADMPGFGSNGAHRFLQYAWVAAPSLEF